MDKRLHDVLSGNEENILLGAYAYKCNADDLETCYELELASCDDLSNFVSVGHFENFCNVTSPKFRHDFFGKMRYRFEIEVKKTDKRVFLDLGRVQDYLVMWF